MRYRRAGRAPAKWECCMRRGWCSPREGSRYERVASAAVGVKVME